METVFSQEKKGNSTDLRPGADQCSGMMMKNMYPTPFLGGLYYPPVTVRLVLPD
jgi:hypothetical protein